MKVTYKINFIDYSGQYEERNREEYQVITKKENGVDILQYINPNHYQVENVWRIPTGEYGYGTCVYDVKEGKTISDMDEVATDVCRSFNNILIAIAFEAEDSSYKAIQEKDIIKIQRIEESDSQYHQSGWIVYEIKDHKISKIKSYGYDGHDFMITSTFEFEYENVEFVGTPPTSTEGFDYANDGRWWEHVGI